ncbi:PREDICTED: uncharacterized protein LOC108566598 [Nicrophorus vespilloides]|uniref:Uncharacterized protein LOC108566598 n=1 Tax=Nicrophorus vespilloides TaxID=110193 RepID=A0ABM1N5G0_NICVS|nr:PREDICTED: uncharacterized protein LOC108566598 [Nicrophorus vespilloides]
MDDFLNKKKESGPVLDLSKAIANTKEEFRKLFDKVPDFKIKPEKLKHDDTKVRDNVKRMKFKTGRKDFKTMRKPFQFHDPIPVEMLSLKISELAVVPIDWKMLTSKRPKSKNEENFFSRMIELKKFELKAETKSKSVYSTDPHIRKVKNRGGVIEWRVVNCPDCQEDFCTGDVCKLYSYDSFVRVPEPPVKSPPIKSMSIEIGGRKKTMSKKIKKKGRKQSPSKKKKTKRSSKSKSPTRKK